MSTLLAPELPVPVRRMLAAVDAAEGAALGLLTVDTTGWPRQALISVGEVVALDDVHLRLASWPGSTTTGNLVASGRAVLTAVAEGAGYSVALALTARGALHLPEDGQGPDVPGLPSVFDARVIEARADAVPYAVLQSGVSFRLVDPAATGARWDAVRTALRDLPPA